MKIAIASPPYPKSIQDGLFWIEKFVTDASEQQAEIICFPESYIPGYPGLNLISEKATPENLQAALDKVCTIAAENNIAVIIPMDWYEKEKLLNTAHVISKEGTLMGYQTKNQLDPSEDHIWTAGKERRIFEVNGLRFGITICHEGFRYPESVRWAAQQGAKIVFHPHFAGSDSAGVLPVQWGGMDNPYYEKAMMMRALENTIYFASSNYATRFPESASSLIAPDGSCLVHARYGETGIIVATIEPGLATGLLAKRFKNELYGRR
jgi:predicted amidohydrolase